MTVVLAGCFSLWACPDPTYLPTYLHPLYPHTPVPGKEKKKRKLDSFFLQLLGPRARRGEYLVTQGPVLFLRLYTYLARPSPPASACPSIEPRAESLVAPSFPSFLPILHSPPHRLKSPTMSFSADKVSHLKGAFSHRRFSSSKDPTESGTYSSPSPRFGV